MSFWNYIGEFFLFRWLFGKFKKSAIEHYAHIEHSEVSIDRNSKYLNASHNRVAPPVDVAVTAAGDDLIDDPDNSEDLDDLDIFMRDNKGNDRSYLHQEDYGSDYHSSCHDWNSISYAQLYDDFHDEQDDYDMMDDDF